jgi:VanZ family protein
VAAWLCIIFWFSTGTFSGKMTSRYIDPLLLWLFPGISASGLRLGHFLIRKAAHLSEYAVLAMLLVRALWPVARASWLRLVGPTLGICAAYALLDEFHQSFVPSRTGSLLDVGFDFSGALLGTALFVALRSIAASKKDLRPEGRLPAGPLKGSL